MRPVMRGKSTYGQDASRNGQRIRPTIALLRKAIREGRADHHVLIVCSGDRVHPEYTRVLRFDDGG